MVEETVNVNGTEFNARELEETLYDYEAKQHLVSSENIIIVDDGYRDNDVAVINRNTGDRTHSSPESIRERIDEATETSFVEYVRKNVSLANHESVEQYNGDMAKIVDSDNQLVTRSAFFAIEKDDGIEISNVEVEDDELQIRLADVRDD